MNKTCQKCKIEKSINEFGIDKSKNDGKLIYCKNCHRDIQKEYYKQNSEKQKLRQKLRRDSYKNDPSYKKWRSIQNKKYRENHANEIHERKIKNRDVLLKRKRELRRLRLENKPELVMLESSKGRAKKKNLEHTITIDDIQIPEICPVLGIPLKIGVGLPTDNSPSLDRIDNSKGYTKENIIVVSHRANTLKRNATIEELEKVVNFYKQL